ncbi:ATP-binding cassette domain-containing protein [Patescibacteria group bacterium]|nr:ATP-binding cassette domain-containing protein [Patescibacteria group bacterium]
MLSVKNISKTFGTVQALNDLSFEVSQGEIVGLLGPNGAGKTTTMRVMSGFLYPDEGEVLIDGISVLSNPVKAQESMGYLPENNPLYKDMLASEVLDLAADLKKIPEEERRSAVKFVVDAVGIKDVYYRPVGELSKGYKQRLGIAVALLNNPKILIMDEPTEGLDPNQRREIRDLIKKLAKEHTILISTHVMQEVEALCTRAIVINEGQKVADGSTDELSRGAKNEKTVHLVVEGKGISKILKDLKKVKEISIDKIEGSKYDVRMVLETKDVIQPDISKLAAKNGWVIWSLNEVKQHLEDVFKELTS